jgi:fibronectin-binding autotransporter adhesin
MTKALAGMGMGVRLASAVVAITLLSNLPAMAGQNLFWSGNGTTQGGVGTWNTTVAHWDTTAGGPYATIWNNANVDSAEFGNTAGQVNLTGPIIVNTITTDLAGVNIGNANAAGATNTITFSGANAGVNTNYAGGTTTISAVMNGTVIKSGAGRMELGNANNPNTIKYVLNGGALTSASIARISTNAPTALVQDFFTFNGGGWGINTGNQDTGATRGITIKSGGAFFGASATTINLTISSPIVGTEGGGLTITNVGPFVANSHQSITLLTLNNQTATPNSWNGNATIATGTLRLGAANQIPDTAIVNMVAGTFFDLATNTANETVKSISGGGGTVQVGGASLVINNPTGETYGGLISSTAAGTVTKNGSGAFTMNGASVGFNGEFVMNNGTLGVGNSSVFGNAASTSKVTINGGIFSNTGTGGKTIPAPIPVAINADFGADDSLFNSSAPGQILFNGPITLKNGTRTITVNGTANLGLGGVVDDEGATRGIIKNGNGTLALPNAANTYTGSTTINAGSVSLDADGTLGTGAGNLILNGGALNASASRSGTGSIVLNPVQVTASSSITCSASAATPIFEFSGALTGTAGQALTFRDDAAAATQFKPRFSGTFTFDSDINMPTGSGAAAATVQLESFNTTGTTQTFTGTISGTGSYNRSASTAGSGGTTVFTGSNTYSGGTSVARGTLLANNTSGSATGSGAVSVGGNGTLGGKGRVDGLVTVSNFGIVAPGNPGVNNGIDTLTLKGGLTVQEGGNLNFDLGAPGTGDKIDLLTSTLILPATSSPATFVNVTDAGGLAAGTYTLIDYGTNDPSGSLSNVTVAGPGGFNYSLFDNTTTTAIELHVTSVVVGLPGDFNSDGKVDAADYATWRKNEVANLPLPNDGGAANQADRFTLWRGNFGNPPGAGSGGGLGGAAVPEPSAIALLAIGLLAIGCRRRG